jgi:hypothetical protein
MFRGIVQGSGVIQLGWKGGVGRGRLVGGRWTGPGCIGVGPGCIKSTRVSLKIIMSVLVISKMVLNIMQIW